MLLRLREICVGKGFDLCDPIHTKWYNDLIEEEGHVASGTLQKIPEPPTIVDNENDVGKRRGQEKDSCQYNAVLIGNSKTIWPKFISWLSSRYEERFMLASSAALSNKDKDEVRARVRVRVLNELLNDSPFDTFIMETLEEVFHSCFVSDGDDGGIVSQLESYEVFWSHGFRQKVDLKSHHLREEGSARTSTAAKTKGEEYHCYAYRDESEKQEEMEGGDENSSFLVSMQRVAKVTGKYWHDEEGTKLCVHPIFGTWKAFRSLVVFHTLANEENEAAITIPPPYPRCPCPVAPEEIEQAKEVMEYALKMSNSGSEKKNEYGTVSIVSKGKNKELCQYLHHSTSSGSDWSKVSPAMRPWIQLRDCITVGRNEYKYCDNQLLYHYTKDVEILKKELFHNKH